MTFSFNILKQIIITFNPKDYFEELVGVIKEWKEYILDMEDETRNDTLNLAYTQKLLIKLNDKRFWPYKLHQAQKWRKMW